VICQAARCDRAAYPTRAAVNNMTKKTSRARKRPAKAKPAEADARSVEQIVLELLADPAVEAALNAAYPPKPSRVMADFFENPPDLGPKVDPFESKDHCWSAAIHLFYRIKEHHGAGVAKHMFSRLAKPPVQERKRLAALEVWTAFQLLERQAGKPVPIKAAARHLHNIMKIGTSVEAVRELLQRVKKRPPDLLGNKTR
jgi:hypothetical protein